jgi:hypothetical protein
VRWRSDASTKPHRRALIQEDAPDNGSAGAVREIDVKKMKVRANINNNLLVPYSCQCTPRPVQGVCGIWIVSTVVLQVDEHKVVVQRAMSTKDPDVQPFLKRLHERMDR